MIHNPDGSKQAQYIVFSYKKNHSNHTNIYFNNIILFYIIYTHKHLALFKEAKLSFSKHINEKKKKKNQLKVLI